MWSEVKLLSRVWLFVTPWTVTYQAPRSMGFSRQEYWSGLPFPSPGDLPNPGTEPGLPNCRQTLYCLSHQGSPSKYSQRPKIRRQLCRRSTGRGKSLSSKTYQERPLLLSKWMIVAWIWATVMDGEKLLGHWIYSKYIQLIACTAAFWFLKIVNQVISLSKHDFTSHLQWSLKYFTGLQGLMQSGGPTSLPNCQPLCSCSL